MTECSAVRDHLIDALRPDLIGPAPRNDADEPWVEAGAPNSQEAPKAQETRSDV